MIILVQLTHSKHRLEPLNIGFFSSINKEYSTKILRFVIKSQRFVSKFKQLF